MLRLGVPSAGAPVPVTFTLGSTMSRLTDEDRKAFWRSGTGRVSKFIFKSALAAFLLPIAVTIFFVAVKNPNINGVGIGLGVVVSVLLLLFGLVISFVGLTTYRKKDAP
jgi:hypothetical protein